MRVAAYYRVSSGKQRDRETIAGQKTEVRSFIEARGHELVAEFEDDGRSARKARAKRTGLEALLQLVRSGRVEAVVTVALDRWTRAESLRERYDIIGEVQEAGVLLLESSGGRIDLSTFEGRLVASTKLELAAEESAEKSRRCRRGRLRAAAEGRNPGRTPYGYHHGPEGWSAPGGAAVLECYERAFAPLWEVARSFNERGIRSESGRPWSAGMVREIIRCRRGNGDPYVTGQWIGHRGAPAITVPAIVPPELAARARAAVAGRAHAPPRSVRYVYLLDDRLCRCALCGAWLGVVSCQGRRRQDGTRARFAYYACANRYGGKARGTSCTMPLRRVERVDEAVWRAVLAWVDSGAVVGAAAGHLAERRSAATGDLEEAQARLAAEDGRLAALAEALGEGAISAESYRAQKDKVKARRDFLAQQVATWRAATQDIPEPVVTPADRAQLRLEVRAAGEDVGARRELVRRLWPSWIADMEGVAPLLAEQYSEEVESASTQPHHRRSFGRVAL